MADYFTALLSDCLGEDYPLITRSEFPALLTDDVRLHVLQSRAAAAEWAVSETHRPVRVAAAHVIATGHGLLVAATLTAPHHDPWHYLAVPHSLFDTVADRVHDDPPPGSPAAVDCRLNHDLSSMWQFEAALRRMLDDYPAFELELAGDQ
ncbi:MAG: hypothetical protein PGN27_15160 [Mycolicibacterium neoaurum]|uniref:hypothetical protein n=1 Tax=Mycolicibacterium neoaurum TaxID=1795 RepID=UPI002FF49A27